ncbi:MAG: hypothetical protein ACP5VE_05330 [Chthonomonadales bacterium]
MPDQRVLERKAEASAQRQGAPVAGAGESPVLVLTTSLLTDRILLHTSAVGTLASHKPVRVWASSAVLNNLWEGVPACVELFPKVQPFREFPFNHLRRVNEAAWDHRLKPVSRISMERHFGKYRKSLYLRFLKLMGMGVASARLEPWFEARLEQLLLRYPRSPEAASRLASVRPRVVVSTGPYQFNEPAVVAAAKVAGIPVVAYIPSFDNITTKNRLVLTYDAYIVWSEDQKRQLQSYYPAAQQVPVYAVGAPQYDVFFQQRFIQTRAEFCAAIGLRSDRPIILYALGSPNLLKGEADGALEFARWVAQGRFGDAQLIVRPHPLFDNGELAQRLAGFGPRVVLQRPVGIEAGCVRSHDATAIREWVNSFRHADVVVNLSSTVSVDAALWDRPVVNLDYDPAPGGPQTPLIRDINHVWCHFSPITASNAVWLASNPGELVQAVHTYLAHPELHRAERRRMVEQVCGKVDGHAAERWAQAILDAACVTHPLGSGGHRGA